MLVCLDELGNAVPLPNLAEIASTAASHNIQLVSIFHDIAQARSRYHDQALTVINNHRARMLLSGVADIETLKYFSDLVGDEEIKDRTEPHAPVRRRPLAPPDQLRQIKPEHGLLIYGSLKPAHAQAAALLQRPQTQTSRMNPTANTPTGRITRSLPRARRQTSPPARHELLRQGAKPVRRIVEGELR